jgi:hypothetical protein
MSQKSSFPQTLESVSQALTPDSADVAFNLLYGFIIVRLDRRELVWIAVTNSPTADWIARQITEAFPWESAVPVADQLPWRSSRTMMKP